MKKKIGISLLLALLVSCLFALAGCGAHEHSWDEGKITTPATCSAQGVKTYSCACGETKTEPVAVDPNAHSWNEGEITTPATCSAPGVKTYTCTLNSAHTRTEDVEKDETAHPFTEEWEHNENKHWHLSTCEHAVKSGEADHEWEVVKVILEATCVRQGSQEMKCSVCGETKTEQTDIDPGNHPYASAWTGGEEGHFHAALCSHGVHTDPEEHTFDGGKITKEADCGVAGETTYTCTVCQWKKTEPLPASKEHTFDETQWKYNTEGHWNPPTCAAGSKVDHSDVRGNYGAHTSKTEQCTVCGYQPVAVQLAYELQTDEHGQYAVITGFAEGVDPATINDLYIPDTLGGAPVREIAAGNSSVGTLNTDNAMKSISIPATLLKFGDYCFRTNNGLKKVYFRGTLEQWLSIDAGWPAAHPLDNGYSGKMDKELYIGETLLTEVVVPASITDIPARAFYYVPAIKKIVIPSTVRTIGDDAFRGCTDVTALTIESGVTKIGSSAFAGLKNLNSVTIPDSVTAMSSGIFRDCLSLEHLGLPFVGASASPKEEKGIIGYLFYTTSSKPNKVDEGYTTVTQRCKRNNGTVYAQIPSSLRSVTVTGGTLSYGAFSGMSILTEIKLPKDLKDIPTRAFYGCSGITSIDFGTEVETIKDFAFSGCTSLATVDLGTKLQIIGINAFQKCAFESITIPATLTKSGEKFDTTDSEAGTFTDCKQLKKVVISDLAAWCRIVFTTAASNPLFNGAQLYLLDDLLEEITVPDSVTALNNFTFANCTGIKKITITAQVVTVYNLAFYGLSGTKIVFSDPTGWTLFDSDFFTDAHDKGPISAEKLTGELDVAVFLNGGEFDWKYLHKKDA